MPPSEPRNGPSCLPPPPAARTTGDEGTFSSCKYLQKVLIFSSFCDKGPHNPGLAMQIYDPAVLGAGNPVWVSVGLPPS